MGCLKGKRVAVAFIAGLQLRPLRPSSTGWSSRQAACMLASRRKHEGTPRGVAGRQGRPPQRVLAWWSDAAPADRARAVRVSLLSAVL